MLVCAHRGASLRLPDNSVPAFRAAIEAGADVIETDVRRAPDGRLVLAHDPWDIIEGVVPLDALLELADGRIGLDLEVVEPGIEADVVAAVGGFAGWLAVTSTLPSVLVEVRRRAPSLVTGLVVEAPYDGSTFAGDPVALADACDARLVLVEDPIATPAVRERAARPLWVWTVNSADRLGELLADSGVAGVITDDPALAVRLRPPPGPPPS